MGSCRARPDTPAENTAILLRSLGGTDGSNPPPSSGESCELRFRNGICQHCAPRLLRCPPRVDVGGCRAKRVSPLYNLVRARRCRGAVHQTRIAAGRHPMRSARGRSLLQIQSVGEARRRPGAESTVIRYHRRGRQIGRDLFFCAGFGLGRRLHELREALMVERGDRCDVFPCANRRRDRSLLPSGRPTRAH